MSIVPLPGTPHIARGVEVCRCTCCGRAYDAEGWAALPYVGTQSDGLGEVLELRNCTCKSTLTIELRESEP